MTPEQLRALDDVSDRLGALYQIFGRLQDRHAIQDDDVSVIMDELVMLDEAVCNVTGILYLSNPCHFWGASSCSS